MTVLNEDKLKKALFVPSFSDKHLVYGIGTYICDVICANKPTTKAVSNASVRRILPLKRCKTCLLVILSKESQEKNNPARFHIERSCTASKSDAI